MKGSLEDIVAAVEKEAIVEALKNSRGNKVKAAAALGITERIMGLRVNKYDIRPKEYRSKQVY